MDLEKSVQRKKSNDNKILFLGMVIGALFALVVIAITLLLWIIFGKKEETQLFDNSQNGNIKKDGFVDEEMLNKISTIESLIDVYYYKDDVSAETLEEGVYRGVLDAVGDPYTCYYTGEELDKLMEHTSGIYYGIGAYVSMDSTGMYPMVTKPIPGSPAEEAGLRPNDIIYEIDGVSTYGKDLDSAVSLIKGKEGTEVEVTIVRSTEKEPLHVTLVRRKVESPTVTYEMLDDGMAYIQIAEFSDITVDQFEDALASARAEQMKGLIIDLRANPGGSLTAVVEIGRMLLPKGLIVYTEDKYGNRSEHKCDGKKKFDKPLVVLVDGNSASASEVLAGAIKDYELGTLVGTTTFGKGIVQQVLPLKDGSALKITTSSYYSPKGTNIHGTGIEPDKVCEFDSEAYYAEESVDNQLEYAKEVLKEMMK